MKLTIIALLAAFALVACQGNQTTPVVVQPPVTVPAQPVEPEVPCQKDEKIHFVVCDSAAVGNCKYHTSLNDLLMKAKVQEFKNCITYRGTEVMSGAAPCLACKKPGYND